MSALKTIAERAAEKNLPFLVIGGHAVVAHGFPRQTFDLDIVVRRSDSEEWRKLTGELGYVFRHEGPAFLQFDAPNLKDQALDIMLATDELFEKFTAEAVPSPSSGGGAKIIALLHLIALKCHAIKYGHERRIIKDSDDVIRLMQANRLDPENPEIRAIFLKHGTPDFYEKVRRTCKKN